MIGEDRKLKQRADDAESRAERAERELEDYRRVEERRERQRVEERREASRRMRPSNRLYHGEVHDFEEAVRLYKAAARAIAALQEAGLNEWADCLNSGDYSPMAI